MAKKENVFLRLRLKTMSGDVLFVRVKSEMKASVFDYFQIIKKTIEEGKPLCGFEDNMSEIVVNTSAIETVKLSSIDSLDKVNRL